MSSTWIITPDTQAWPDAITADGEFVTLASLNAREDRREVLLLVLTREGGQWGAGHPWTKAQHEALLALPRATETRTPPWTESATRDRMSETAGVVSRQRASR